jgi:hypothetical protein
MWQKRNLDGYDGAVNGVNILHRIAVEAEVVSGLPGREEIISAPGHTRPPQPEQDMPNLEHSVL